MRNSIFNLALLLLAFVGAAAQPARQDEPRSFPITHGSEHDGFAPRLKVRGTISQIDYAPPHCGELIFPATLEVKLDAKLNNYKHPYIYLVVPCLYQPADGEKFLNQHIEVSATKQTDKRRPCFFDIGGSPFNSGGVPFYCVDREQLLKSLMGRQSSKATGPIEFDGTLEEGSTYRALVRRNREQEWRTVAPLKLPLHHAARVEWLNLKDFPELNKPQPRSRLKQFVFKVTARKILQFAGHNRWSTTYYCQIIAVKDSAG